MSKLEHYTDSGRTEHAIATDRIISILRYADDAVSAKELADAVPVEETTVRDLVSNLRETQRLPVYGTSQGYVCIESGAELDDVIESIQDEIATKERTMSNLIAAYYARQ